MWSKKENASAAPETSASPDLKGLAQPASPEPEVVSSKKITTPDALLTPEAQAYTNTLVNAAIKGIFAQLGPVLESIALTPEKLAQAEELRRKPDAAVIARELRERKLMHVEQEENRARLLQTQAACPHRYPTGQLAIGIIRNYPDRQARGTCMLCQTFFTPKEWRIGAPDAENPRGKAFIADAHPQYDLVRQVLAAKG
jgi:hypothetical protein